jgi:uncharacterized protein YlaI
MYNDTGLTRAQVYSIRRFGITVEDYLNKLKDQNYRCAICDKEETSEDPRYTVTKRLSIDHCHKTGKIRGLLCVKCNSAIGHFNDDIEMLQKGVEYLKSYQE